MSGTYLDGNNIDFDLGNYRESWLKGRTTQLGNEITLYLSESMTKGSRREFLNNLVSGQYFKAREALKSIIDSSDGHRFSDYVDSCEFFGGANWVIQTGVDTMKVKLAKTDQVMNTVLRIHFIPDETGKYLPFMQMYADKQRRVNASGFTIPIRYR